MKTLLLIDAHAMIHRAYHALPELTNKDGIPTNAVYGFFMILQKVLSEFQPTHLAVCFDTPKPTFRKELFKEYQSKRPPMETTLKTQIPLIKELLDTGGVTRLEKPGFEADDVIGTITEKHKKDFDRILILTGDKDLLQLTDDNVFVITPKQGVSNFNLYTPEAVVQKFGVSADLVPDYKALAGDSSDNYNTAKGIGPKTAVKLLTQFHTIEGLIKHVKEVENEKWRITIQEHKETILLFKQIATIVRDVDIDATDDELVFEGFDQEMKSQLLELNLNSLITKLYAIKTLDKTVEKQKLIPEQKKDDGQIELF
ncbi:MAG TPA: 5'-3' exonuclease H3TH domain-containing protein [Candidatus Woesebacteria bacterium]|mgnify:CR=1 FL=1|nr:5'-3' exonuclease H3TH domain-containing protein [Candidatus Woesebacteria bacterium]